MENIFLFLLFCGHFINIQQSDYLIVSKRFLLFKSIDSRLYLTSAINSEFIHYSANHWDRWGMLLRLIPRNPLIARRPLIARCPLIAWRPLIARRRPPFMMHQINFLLPDLLRTYIQRTHSMRSFESARNTMDKKHRKNIWENFWEKNARNRNFFHSKMKQFSSQLQAIFGKVIRYSRKEMIVKSARSYLHMYIKSS